MGFLGFAQMFPERSRISPQIPVAVAGHKQFSSLKFLCHSQICTAAADAFYGIFLQMHAAQSFSTLSKHV